MADEKYELIGQIARARAELSESFGEVRRDVDVPAKLRRSYGNHKLLWLAGAAIAGVVLAKLPARKKKVHAKQDSAKTVLHAAETGIALIVLRFVLASLRPAISAFVAKKV